MDGCAIDKEEIILAPKTDDYSSLVQQALGVLVLMLVSWHIPRYLTVYESTLATKIPPFQTLQDGQVILNPELSHPLVEPATIPSSLLIVTSVVMPFLLILLLAMCGTSSISKPHYLLHHNQAALCAFGTALALSEGPTQLLKLYIQRPRPNFYVLCGFDASQQRCTAGIDHVREANFSFPSGHSSLSACACVFMTWHVCGMMVGRHGMTKHWSMRQRRFACLFTSTLFLAWTLFVGASRLHDHWHHYADVVAGLLLGSLAATLGYHAWYPPIWSVRVAGLPYSLVVEQSVGVERQK